MKREVKMEVILTFDLDSLRKKGADKDDGIIIGIIEAEVKALSTSLVLAAFKEVKEGLADGLHKA